MDDTDFTDEHEFQVLPGTSENLAPTSAKSGAEGLKHRTPDAPRLPEILDREASGVRASLAPLSHDMLHGNGRSIDGHWRG